MISKTADVWHAFAKQGIVSGQLVTCPVTVHELKQHYMKHV